MTITEIERRLDELRQEINALAEHLPTQKSGVSAVAIPEAALSNHSELPAVTVREFMGCSYVTLTHPDSASQSATM